jgi:hypothetical protein
MKLIPGNAVNDWSWWAVTAPLWAPVALLAVIWFVVFISLVFLKMTEK